MRFKKINHILFFPTIPLSLFSNILHYICFILGQKKYVWLRLSVRPS